MSRWAIACQQLRKTYPGRPPVEAVRGIDLHIRPGECFGVLGPNGAGKTTTIEILEGLLEPTSGTAEILGMQWGRDDQQIRQRIGISLQETELSDRLTVRETLTLFRSFYPRGLAVDEAIRRVSLEDKSGAWVKKLSGGQKQRLAVATALVGDPDLVFLDEPTTGLDPGSRRQLWEIIQGFTRSGKTVLLTTHYMDEAERLCDRIAIVDRGVVIAEGTPPELIRSIGAGYRIELAWEGNWPDRVAADILALPHVENIEQGEQRVTVVVDQPHAVLPPLVNLLAAAGVRMTSLATRQASLEDVFLRLTGRHIDEASGIADDRRAGS